MDQTYEGRLDVELWDQLKTAMAPLGDETFIGNIVDEIEKQGGFQRTEAPEPDHRAVDLTINNNWYAIESKDLNFIAGVSSLLGGGVKLATAVSALAGASSAIGFIGGLLAFCWNIQRRHIPLKRTQGLLLYGITRQPGKRAKPALLASAYGFDIDEVEATLQGMTTLLRNDNTEAKIVRKDEKTGEWLAVGV